MIDAIRDLMHQGVQMDYASKVGVRQLHFQEGKVSDPLGEVDAYSVELSYHGRTLIRFYKDGAPAGYLEHQRHGVWQGNNRSVWTQLKPVDQIPWLNLRNYVPPKKTKVQPIVENVQAIREFDSYESSYDWEPTSQEAIVFLVKSANTSIVQLLESGQLETRQSDGTVRDVIVELDGLPIVGLNDLQNKVKDAAQGNQFPVHTVLHRTHFGEGRLTVNAHQNAFKKYERVLFVSEPVKFSDSAFDLAFRLYEYEQDQGETPTAATVYGITANDGAKFKTTDGMLENVYVMDKAVWSAIETKVLEFKKLFLINEYASRPHHSIIKWVYDEFQVRLEVSDVLKVMDMIAHRLLDSRVVGLETPRACKVGEPYSSTQDKNRKTFN